MRKVAVNCMGIFFALFTVFALAASAHAGTYLGELKWVVSPAGEGATKQTLVTGITHTGGNYFLVQGYLNTSDGDGVIIYDGSAIIMEDELIMTLNATHQHVKSQWRDSHTYHSEIDLSSWRGEFWAIGKSYDLEGKRHDLEDFFQGSIRLILD